MKYVTNGQGKKKHHYVDPLPVAWTVCGTNQNRLPRLPSHQSSMKYLCTRWGVVCLVPCLLSNQNKDWGVTALVGGGGPGGTWYQPVGPCRSTRAGRGLPLQLGATHNDDDSKNDDTSTATATAMDPVTKASWYAVEAFGKVFGTKTTLDTVANSSGGAVATDAPPKTVSETMARIKQDNEREYFLSGDIDKLIYDEQCEFSDPFVSFRGRDRFIDNLENLGSFITAYSARPLSYDQIGDNAVQTKFMVKLQLGKLPWKPVLAWPWGVLCEIDPSTCLVVRHVESWDIEAWEGVQQIFRKPTTTIQKVEDNAVETKRMVKRRTSARRQALCKVGSALVAGAILTSPHASMAASTPSMQDLERLQKGHARVQYLLSNWDDVTKVCGRTVMTDTERKQQIRTNGGGGTDACIRTPLVVQDYLGYKSTTDPLFKVDKLMLQAVPLATDPDAYLDVVERYRENADAAAVLAYTSSWAGEENPNGSAENIENYLEKTRGYAITTEDLLRQALRYLDLVVLPANDKP